MQGRTSRGLSCSRSLARTMTIITSLLDTVLYKFTMMQVVLHHFPAANVEYRFRCRTPGIDLVPCIDEIRDEVRKLCQLRFTDAELDYLRRLRFIKGDFIEFLALFHLNEKYISIAPSPKGNGKSRSVSPARGCIRSSSKFRCSRSSTRFTSATRNGHWLTRKVAGAWATRSRCWAPAPNTPIAGSPTTGRAVAFRRPGTKKWSLR